MAYEEMVDLGTDNVVALGGVNSKTGKPNPTEIEGRYLGARAVTTSNGPSVIHVFQTPTGSVGVWGTKKLNDNLPGSEGYMLFIKYKGKVKIAGGKTQHTYSFGIDRADKTEVSRMLSTGTNKGSGTENSYADLESDNSDAANEDTEAADALALLERKAQQKRLQDMLNKNKTAKS